MLCRYFMPRTYDAALEQRICGLDAVRGDVAINIDAVVVVRGQVGSLGKTSLRDCRGVRWPLIRHNHVNIFRDVFLDVLRQCSRLHIFSLEEPQIAVTLLDADHNGFVVIACLPMTVLGLSADQSLVHLHNAVQGPLIDFLHRRTNAMAEIPCRLVGNAQNALQLICAHALLRLTEKVDAQEPLPQRQMRVIEDRSSSHGELVTALVAIELIALDDLRDIDRLATWAHNRIWPAERFEVFAALVLAAELFDQSNQIHGVFHA